MDQTTISYHHLAIALLLYCLIPSSIAKTLSITTDQSALFALKSSISHDPRNVITTNWSSSSPVCSWIGITCSFRHQRVTSLDISDMSLEGRIPSQLGNLSFLSSLRMSNNSFDGSLPLELANLRRLRLLHLTNNNFTGPFPSFITSLPNLRFLYLSRNAFSGSIPASIANLTNLEELGLSRNLLEGNFPETISDLRRLTFLNLEGNRLTGPLPSSVFNLSALQVIALTRNNLTGKLPESVCDHLPMLEGLYISSNWFDGTIPAGLQRCRRLEVLSISGNEFVGSIPREIGNLTRLTVLHLGANHLEGEIPKEIGNLQKLEVLGLNWNKLTGSIPASIFNLSSLQVFASFATNLSGELPSNFGMGTPNLEDLHLGRNNLSGFLPDSISNASKLTIIDLAGNSFTGPIPDSLGNLKGLQLLNLGSNRFTNPSPQLTFLTSLSKCRFLNELVIADNPLGGTLPTSVGDFSTSLTIFAAYRCKIHGEIPWEIGKVSNLTMLSLADNELSGNIPTTIVRLKKLQELYLRDNRFTGFIPDEVCSLGNLGALDLGRNRISGALPECVGNMTSLRNLYLDSNRLNSTLPSRIWNLNGILRFNASSNMLSGNLPQEIGNLKAATLIDLSTNNLSGDIPATVGGLESLIDLSLANNRLEGPIPESLGRILSLESLDFSHNYLTGEIPKPLENLSYLRLLNLSFNKLTGEIPDGGPFVNFTEASFMSNEALCGHSQLHFPQCRSDSPNRPRRKGALRIALFAILPFASITIALFGLGLLRLKRKRKSLSANQIQASISPHRIPYHELLQATNGFSETNVIGRGGFSSVYKASLRDGSVVAVKVINLQKQGGFKSFDKECEVLRNLRHRNLVRVISCCTNADFRALVLEYMPRGSLEKWLYSGNRSLPNILERLNIVLDVGSGVEYLHNGYVMPVVHCDLKPSNVLIDEEMVAYVSDFGISKIFGAGENTVQTNTLATIGYIAPEYGVEGLVSTRSDTYSFGILLMETFTRRKPTDEMFAGELSLRQWINESLPSQIVRVVDPNLVTQEERGGIFDAKVECLLCVMEVALKCTEELPHLRISMEDAVIALKKIKLQFLASCGKS